MIRLITRKNVLPPCTLLILTVLACLPSLAQMTSVGIECSQIKKLGIDKQENLRAGIVMIECGQLPAGDPSLAHEGEETLVPLSFTNILVSNRSCSSSSSCTKSESMVWADSVNGGETIVDNYNDHNPTYSTYTGTSYSTNGGATFTEIEPPPFASGHGTNYGDPVVVYNTKLGEWFAGDLATGCGGFGIGLWTSTDGIHWTTGACAHSGTADDRESMWVDNEPSSGTYGRMYVSWDNGAVNAGALSVTHSDDGVTWRAPVVLFPNTTFTQRNVQVTGSPVGAARYEGTNSTVFVAAMDEGGGGFNTRQNVIYKSLDGGNTWTSTTTGPRFNPPGSLTCGYFAVVAPIWRHMGWGQPAVGPNGVVHYDYAGAGTNGDVGDIFYVRSTDNGRTWSTPVELNTDADNVYHTQWMPSLAADLNGKVTASWYDRRAATSSCVNTTDPGCSYERVGRQSTNNGASFGSELTISSQIIPQPTQTDPNVVSCYAGDYDYDNTLSGDTYDSWTDGRVAVSGVQVQNVEFASIAPSADFSLAISPASETVIQGSNTSYTVSVGSVDGFTGSVTLSVPSGLPSGASASFTTNPVAGGSGNSTLNVTTASTTPTGTYTLVVEGVSGSLTHTLPATLVVSPPPPWSFSSGLPPNSCNYPSSFVSFSLDQQTSANSLQWSESLSESFEGKEILVQLSWNWTLSDQNGYLLSGSGLGTENLTASRAPIGTPTVTVTGYALGEGGCYATINETIQGTN